LVAGWALKNPAFSAEPGNLAKNGELPLTSFFEHSRRVPLAGEVGLRGMGNSKSRGK